MRDWSVGEKVRGAGCNPTRKLEEAMAERGQPVGINDRVEDAKSLSPQQKRERYLKKGNPLKENGGTCSRLLSHRQMHREEKE